jgi:phosphatidylglycerol:prolipoprotein diacylglycerol transferase
MYPTLLRIGSFELSSFGVMMFLAFAAAGGLLSRRLRGLGRTADDASAIVVAAAFGGIVGAKIYYAILFRDWHLLFDRAGLVWYGGFIGGVLAVSYVIRRRGLPFPLVADAAAPAVALGYAIGRVGCFLVGDDYGRPTESWVGIAFPNGAPPSTVENLRNFGALIPQSVAPGSVLRVHPTQLYEVAGGLVMLAILLVAARYVRRRGALFALFLLLAGVERLIVEVFRAKDDRVFGPLTVAQAISVLLILIGGAVLTHFGRRSHAPLPNDGRTT